jgi:molybdopterin-guanine dinucleotide biosynthesis protein A
VDYAHLNLRVLPDVYPNSGFFSGLAAVLDASEGAVLVLPCDLPYIDASIISKLSQAPGVYPLGCKGPKRTHPLIARYPKAAATTIHRFAKMQGSVHDAFEACKGRWVTFDSERPFTNVNTPEQLSRLS